MINRRPTAHGPAARRTAVRRTPGRRAALGTLAGVLTATLAGCGIEPTDVIDAGEPATGVRAPGKPPADVQLFFYGPDGLHPATRPAKEPLDPQDAINLLVQGPNHAERMRGLSSVVPKFPAPLTATSGPGRVAITLPVNAKLVDPASLNQLVCTAANARVPGDKPPGQVTVTLVGDGVRVGPMVCGGNNAFPLVQPTPTGANDSAGEGG
ncbi:MULTISPECIES: hypothetical protein [Streptomyces]|uniref:hypothetical protein n=1 Tax=Streptomyces TaxID=1883 RepID=UPI00196351AD|nr:MULTISPECIES: hypothetical protein [Streptomyces]QRX96252.1 hypothetical protein JNO44_40560 [Streptomyces noursei]UJB44994.1 hypothetical protein HRD51_33170 [Streptomyces sp. A1-5]